MPIQVEDKIIYSLSELQESMNVTKKTLRNYIRDGKLKARKIGREQYVTEQSLVEFLEAKNTKR